jgi:hypothetical protein
MINSNTHSSLFSLAFFSEISIDDTVKPVITLNAPVAQTWEAGGSFCLGNTFVCPRSYVDPTQ